LHIGKPNPIHFGLVVKSGDQIFFSAGERDVPLGALAHFGMELSYDRNLEEVGSEPENVFHCVCESFNFIWNFMLFDVEVLVQMEIYCFLYRFPERRHSFVHGFKENFLEIMLEHWQFLMDQVVITDLRLLCIETYKLVMNFQFRFELRLRKPLACQLQANPWSKFGQESP
jgi:hypothetical protein